MYGHVTASDAFGDIYVVPIDATLASMKKQLAATVAFLPSAHEIQVARWTASGPHNYHEYKLSRELISNNKVATLEGRPFENLETSNQMSDYTVPEQMDGPTASNQLDNLMFPAETDYVPTPSEMDDQMTQGQTDNLISLRNSLYNLASNEIIDDLTTRGPMSATEFAGSPLPIPKFLCHLDYDKIHLFGDSALDRAVTLQCRTNRLEPTKLLAKDMSVLEQSGELLPDSGYSSAIPTPHEDSWGILEGPKPVSLLGTQNVLFSMCEAAQDESEQCGP